MANPILVEPWRAGLIERGLTAWDAKTGCRRRPHANGTRAAERSAVRQDKCGDIHSVGKSRDLEVENRVRVARGPFGLWPVRLVSVSPLIRIT